MVAIGNVLASSRRPRHVAVQRRFRRVMLHGESDRGKRPLCSWLISPCYLYPKYKGSSLKDLNDIG
jgi:hypothetical protein